MIIFEKVRWKNLLSTGNIFTEVNLTASPSTLIVGENGAGKSTFIEAISFALYGKAFRKINKPQLINSINQKELLVELEFSIGSKKFLIRRGMKPGIFEIIQDGIMINQDAASRDYQEYLEKNILKLNHKSFTQIVTLGSRSFVPFMQLPTGQRREIIEDLLDLQIFSVMNTLLKEKVSDNKENIKDIKYKADICQEKIKLQKEYIKNISDNHKKQIENNLEKISILDEEVLNHRNKINNLTEQVNDLLESIKDTDSAQKKLKEIESLESQFKNKLSRVKTEIDFYENNDNCPTCKQGIEHSFKCESIKQKNQQVETFESNLSEISDMFTNINNRLNDITDVTKKIAEINSEIISLNTKIATAMDFGKKIINENLRLTEEHNENKIDREKLQELKEELRDYVEQHEIFIKQKSIIDVVSVLLKDGGIKSKIIKQYIPVMNKLINKYLASMELTVSFDLDENFNETVRSRHRDEFSYDSFSEGEKTRIDLAILFAWRSISKLRNANSSNLLVLDETFDGSLDSTGMDELLKIIMNVTNDSNVFVISHKDQMVDKFSNVIRFEKVKNFSRIKDAA